MDKVSETNPEVANYAAFRYKRAAELEKKNPYQAGLHRGLGSFALRHARATQFFNVRVKEHIIELALCWIAAIVVGTFWHMLSLASALALLGMFFLFPSEDEIQAEAYRKWYERTAPPKKVEVSLAEKYGIPEVK